MGFSLDRVPNALRALTPSRYFAVAPFRHHSIANR
jgi:hypothetical protein